MTTLAARMATSASALPRSATRKSPSAGSSPSRLQTSVVVKCFASSPAKCQARIPGPAIRSPTTSGVCTTTPNMAGTLSREESLPHSAKRRSSAQRELEILDQQRADASDAVVLSRDEIAIACAQPERVASEDRRGLRSAVRSFDDRQDLGAPSRFVQSCAEVDVFVVREKRLVENRIAEGVAAVKSSGRGDAPSPGSAGVPPAVL